MASTENINAPGIYAEHDELLTISTGRSRKETNWKNKEILWSELVKKLSVTHRTAETYREYISSAKTRQDEIKDIGGFVGGTVSGGRRKAESITNRSIITLDVDFGTADVFDDLVMFYGCACVMYTTHKNGAEQFRGRLVIPLNRPVFRDEYIAISRRVAGTLGIDIFDDTTFEPSRLMYWPSTSSDGEYIFKFNDDSFLDADEVLASYQDWRDVTEWPVSERADKTISREIKKQEDPLGKPGLIGAFCRCYDIYEAIEKFLPDVYEPCGDNRYTYKEGSTTGGLVVYEDKFVYSHHGTDPVSGKLCNAFDLIRIHKFGLKDEDVKDNTPGNKLPSFTAMQEFCTGDSNVRKLLASESIQEAAEHFDGIEIEDEEPEDTDWINRLEITKKGVIESSLGNLILILENDSALKKIVMNELSDGMEIAGRVPWKNPGRWWRDADDAQLISYIDRKYTSFSMKNYDIAVAKVADDRRYHPIKDYFNNLPKWDGIKRADTLFIDYLGASDNPYVRAAARKWLCAAVARIYSPGCKFDCMPVLCGPQGIGKSTLIARLAMSWFSDSLMLADTQDKTAAEKLQGFWILEIGELAGLRKAEVETLRSFLSRQNDIYRASFGRRATPHNRQCVFIGTTNAESGYLRDTTGNRRFWPINVKGGTVRKPWDLTRNDIDQIWAEAKMQYKAGEKLFLEGTEQDIAQQEQREAMESDDREGMVKEYLDTLLPATWNKMDIFQRRNFLDGGNQFDELPDGTVLREFVCPQEIWAECFKKDPASLTNRDSISINAILIKLPEWEKQDKVHKFPKPYGVCRCFKRK